MSIPRGGSRLLHLDGKVYRWRVRRRPTYSQSICQGGLSFAAQSAAHPKGSIMVVTLDAAHPSNWLNQPARAVTPAEVAEYVRRALSLGWQPDEPGVQFPLSVADGDIPSAASV